MDDKSYAQADHSMIKTARNNKHKVIVHYSNRRLYSRTDGHYTTLEAVGRWWKEGWTIHVYQHKGGHDITVSTLLQLILNQVRDGEIEITEAQVRALVKP